MQTGGILVVTYLAAWFLAYLFIMGADFGHLGEYFILGWTGGLEKPGMIQILALGTTLFSGLVLGLVALKKKREQNRAAR